MTINLETDYVNILFWTASGLILYSIFSKIKYRIFQKPCDIPTDEKAEFLTCNSEEDVKMVLVIRDDLKMGKGKGAAQCSHGAIMAYEKAAMENPKLLHVWKRLGQRKIVVKVANEEELMTVARNARKAGLIYAIVKDAGRTQVLKGTKTVVAVGPGYVGPIDQVTGHLQLY